ncbi:MAG: hypothetical protein KFF77_05435 [Bacteroidetes bacterium]|nr:hypothetical protein [Bacteroidota bacterium]
MVRISDILSYPRFPRLTLAALAVTTLLLGFPPAAADGTRTLRPHTASSSMAELAVPTARHADVRKFEGVRSGRDVYLEWITLQEAGNKGFEVQRASSESHGWEEVGFVQGNGDAGDERRYQFRDRNVPPEDLRYMLRVRGTDGLIQYSQIISVPVSGVLRSFRVGGDDAMTAVRTATVELANEENISLVLADHRGNLIDRIAGQTALSSGRHDFPIDFSRLPEGQYELYLYTSEGRYRRTYEYRK